MASRNETGVALALAARTATTSSANLINRNCAGIRVFINVTALVDTPSITVSIEEKDPISGNYVALLTSAAITTTGQKTTLVIYPGLTAAANVVASSVLPRDFRITVTHGDADSITYSICYSLIA